MNFISHFYCHEKEGQDLFNFGLVFPDFLGMVSRRHKLRIFLDELKIGDEAAEFVNGIKHHEKADKIWHVHDYFAAKTEAIKNVLAEYNLTKKPYRPFFMTHVMLEILVDRMIVKHEHHKALAMYSSLQRVEDSFVKKLFIDKELSHKFLLFKSSFLEKRYALQYGHNESFIYALNRLFQRVNHPTIEMKEYHKFVKRLDSLVEHDYKTALEDIAKSRA